MNWTVVGVLIAAIGTIIAIVTGVTSDINKRIEAQLRNPEFVKKVAEQVRLPFIIFDENNTELVNSGGEDYVVNFKVNVDDDGEFKDIMVTTKVFLNIPPMLQNLDGKIQFYNPERIGQRDWKFRAFYHRYVIDEYNANKKPPPMRFRLDIIPEDKR